MIDGFTLIGIGVGFLIGHGCLAFWDKADWDGFYWQCTALIAVWVVTLLRSEWTYYFMVYLRSLWGS